MTYSYGMEWKRIFPYSTLAIFFPFHTKIFFHIPFHTKKLLDRKQCDVYFAPLQPCVKKFYKHIKIGRRGEQINATQAYDRGSQVT